MTCPSASAPITTSRRRSKTLKGVGTWTPARWHGAERIRMAIGVFRLQPMPVEAVESLADRVCIGDAVLVAAFAFSESALVGHDGTIGLIEVSAAVASSMRER